VGPEQGARFPAAALSLCGVVHLRCICLVSVGCTFGGRFPGPDMVGSKLAQFGILTYSLYLVHQFNLQSANGAAELLFRIGVPHLFKIPIEIIAMVMIAAVFWYFCERPFINKPLDRSASARTAPVPAKLETV